MKKIILTFSVLLILAGCTGGKGPAISPVSDFFTRKIEGEISVCAYDSMNYRNYLEEAAQTFEALYPGTKVKIETFSAMPDVRTSEQGGESQVVSIQSRGDPQSALDYLSRVNTNIMSGKGADIYAMDIIPLFKFTAGGTLENLESYMVLDPAFSKDEYRRNILDALQYTSKNISGIWFLPMDYDFSCFAYDAALVPPQIAAGFGVDKVFTTPELFGLGIPLYNGTNKLFSSFDFPRGPGGMFNQLLSENIQFFVNLESGRANFLDGAFSSLLLSVSDYAEKGYIPRSITGQQDAGQVMRQMREAVTDRFFFKLNNNASLISQFYRKTGRMIMMNFGGNAMGVEEDDEIAGIQANAGGKVPFTFNQGFAMNSASKNKECSWAFLKFLLSKDMQLSTNMNMWGLPVNNEAREEKAELVFSGAFYGRQTVMNDQQKQIIEEYKAAVESLSDSINYFVIQDANVNQMISEEVRYFFGGSRSAEEVARVLQNKADLYLSE